MVSDLDLAQAALDVYHATGSWDIYLQEGPFNSVCWGLRRVNDSFVVALRGSSTPLDWMIDFKADLVDTPLGKIHSGFASDLYPIVMILEKYKNQRLYLTGHSLGAARASVLAGLMKLNGLDVDGKATFGEPRIGLNLSPILNITDSTRYVNRRRIEQDPVTLFPLVYGHPGGNEVRLVVNESDVLDVAGLHSMDLYLKGLK